MKVTGYNQLTKAFKQDALLLLGKHIPGKINLARRDINLFLKKEKYNLRRLHFGLVTQVINSEEFGKLFNGIRNSFILPHLKLAGLSIEQIRQLSQMLKKLYRAMTITMTQIKESDHLTKRKIVCIL